MKSKIIKLTTVIMCSFALFSCSKEENPETVVPEQKKEDPVIVNLTDTLCRSWMVKSATHNGSPDNSSTGLKFTMKKDGTYLLVSTGHKGTLEFLEDSTKVLLDKNNSSIKTIWQVNRLTSTHLDVSFKSPFTGGKAVWMAQPY